MPDITLLTGFNIANVEGVKVVTEEEAPATHYWKTMTSFDAEAHIEEGEEKVQRVKNTIMGRLRTEDVVGGYDLNCEDERLIPEILALVDGGTWDSEQQIYKAPVIGQDIQRTAFTLFIYTSDRGGDAEVKNYLEWTFPHTKGTPVKLGAKDNEFHKPSYKLESRPADGESPFTVKVVASLFDLGAAAAAAAEGGEG